MHDLEEYDKKYERKQYFGHFPVKAEPIVGHYDGPPVVGITPARAIFLYHLRVNPRKIPQTTGSLRTAAFGAVGEARCAIGLACQAFNIDVENHTAYALLSQQIQLNSEEIADIWRLNDRLHWTFAQIADRLEEHFLNPSVPIYHRDGSEY